MKLRSVLAALTADLAFGRARCASDRLIEDWNEVRQSFSKCFSDQIVGAL